MSIITSSGTVGWILGSISSLLVAKGFLHWPILYYFSALIFLVSIVLINKLQFNESPTSFEEVISQLPNNLSSLVTTFFMAGINGSLFYLIIVFSKMYINQVELFNRITTEWFITTMLIAYALLLPIAGKLIDKYDYMKLYKKILMTNIIYIVPAIYIMLSTNNIIILFISGTITVFLMSLLMLASLKVITNIFGNYFKYTGIGFSYNLGNAIFGGFTPYISMVIYKKFGTILLPIIFYQFLVLIGFIILNLNYPNKKHRNQP
jgi:MHS family proline/betaine transporter-like MFS transporter